MKALLLVAATAAAFITFPFSTRAGSLPKDPEACYAELYRQASDKTLLCGTLPRLSIEYPCRRYSKKAYKVVPTTCNTKDLSDGQWNNWVKKRHMEKVKEVRKINNDKRAADLAAGRTRAPGVPVTESWNEFVRANENSKVVWHNASPAERAEIKRRASNAMRTSRCRDIYGSGSSMVTVDWCKLNAW